MQHLITDAALKTIWKFIGIIAICIGSIYGADKYLTAKIQSAVQDEALLRKISAKVRPSVIFDQAGSVLVEQGAMESIDNITVHRDTNSPGFDLPVKITVTPKRFLSHAPLLQVIGPYTLTVTNSRGTKFDWVYELSYVGSGNPPPDFKHCQFRLEILY